MSEEKTVPAKTNRFYTKSSSLILPMTGYAFHEIPGIVNCYLADFEQKNNALNFNKIFVLATRDFVKAKTNSYFLKEYRTLDNRYMYLFNVPEEFLGDYHLFLEGKYSAFSSKFKDVLVSKITAKVVQNSRVYQIIHKTAEGRKFIEDIIGQKLPPNAEVSSKLSFKREIYKY